MDQSANSSLPPYALITPARNEATFIEGTIASVISQTYRPIRWVIVSDGSTDGTDEIVTRHIAQNPWIELLRMPERRERNFAGKAHAFRAGCERLARLDYEIIGNLDADVSFEKDYFAFLIQKFVENPKLGVASTPFQEGSFQYDFRIVNIEHVSGQVQIFRRRCFEEIGGYLPLKTGGVDLTAVLTARMKGWQTRTFLEKPYIHNRKMGSANHTPLAGAFNGGRVDYMLGCDPVWQLFRCVYRLIKYRPILLNGSLCLAGYVWAMSTREKQSVSPELVRFRRGEERLRLRGMLKRTFSWPFHHSATQHPKSF
jgi:poly-beta-1,6-N-acetyl-D-glucosamine synthase